MDVSLLLCLARMPTPSLTSTHSLAPRRCPASRPTPSTLSTNLFFNSLPFSFDFLERSRFTSKHRKAKIALMEGLDSVLDRFSEGLRARKILSSLLEELSRSPVLRTWPRSYSIADERPASTAINPPQCALDFHQPLPFTIRFASAPVVEAALCHQGIAAEYDDTL